MLEVDDALQDTFFDVFNVAFNGDEVAGKLGNGLGGSVDDILLIMFNQGFRMHGDAIDTIL